MSKRASKKFSIHYNISNSAYFGVRWLPSWGKWTFDLCSRTFSYEIQFRATFVWSFFYVMRISGSIEHQSEFNFPFLYIIRFQTYSFLEPSSSTRGGDRHMRSRTFLYEIQFRVTFIWSFFWRNAYFWLRWTPKWIWFPISVHYYILNMNVLATWWRHDRKSCQRAKLHYDTGSLDLCGQRLKVRVLRLIISPVGRFWSSLSGFRNNYKRLR